MCGDLFLAPLAGLGGGAATAGAAAAGVGAAGAGVATTTAGLAKVGALIKSVGTVASVVGPLAQGVSDFKQAKSQQRAYEAAAQQEAAIASEESERVRRRLLFEAGRQRLELGARGVALDSPTAITLGRAAADELEYATRATIEGGLARQTELTSRGRAVGARGASALLGGFFSAADGYLTAQADRWENLLRAEELGAG